MRGISGLFQNYNVGMLLLEGPRRRLKGSKETSTKLCVMKRLLSIAEATAHEITPGDYAKKKEVLQRQRGWAQGSRTASSGIWPPHCNTTFGSQTSGQNGPAWRWPLQYFPPLFSTLLDQCRSRTGRPRNQRIASEGATELPTAPEDEAGGLDAPGPCAGARRTRDFKPDFGTKCTQVITSTFIRLGNTSAACAALGSPRGTCGGTSKPNS